jgi:hypothetical protein
MSDRIEMMGIVTDFEPNDQAHHRIGFARVEVHLSGLTRKTGLRVAAIVSVVETCRRLKITLRDHLAWVCPGSPIFQSAESRYRRPESD